MKNIFRTLIAIMSFALVLVVFASCEFPSLECEHSWADATCMLPKTCSLCGATDGEALGHDEEVLQGKDATCTEAGLTDGKKCLTCGEILLAQEEIPAKGHTEEILAGEEPTCTVTGLTEGKKCSVCYEILVAQEEIPVANHTEEVVEGKAPTCTETGLTEGKKCSVCGAITLAQEEIPVADHTEEVVVGKAATCTETGLTDGKKCSVCGKETLAQEIITALGHKDENKDYECDVCHIDLCTDHIPAAPVRENEVAATCSKEGSYDSVVKCSQCGEEISREAKIIEKLTHTEETVSGKEATCTEAGLTEGKKCSVCGEIIVAQEEIAAKGHTEEIILGKEATCTATGLTNGKKCSVCDVILEEQQIIDYLKHIQGEWVVTTYPSCDKEGQKLAQCTVCGSIVAQESIPAGHTLVDGVCTVCGYIPNIFAGKVFVPSSDAAGNMYSSTFGYQTLTDGIIFEEGKGRYSSKQNGGKVEATIDLGAVYDLNEFKVYLYWDGGIKKFGSGLKIEVLFAGEWTTVVDCKSVEELQAYWVDNPDSVDKEWLIFDLGGIAARQVKFTIPGQTSNSGGWTTFYEIECSAKVSEQVEPEPEEPVFVENIFAGKQFTPTDAAKASVLAASWWKGGGYETLTDGIKNADNAPGRFSTVMKATGMMDATIDLGGTYELHSLKFYTYDPAAGTGAGSVGANLLIQVYSNGEWIDVVTCADNASIMSHLVVSGGTYNDYLEFDLGGIAAEKVRLYISASASASGTTYEEIACNGYQK